ncbi:hypothetical protein KEM56_001574 [Ascosphaera pollenicola]|nr:hypothetical protein KEM56_001574 [Ascosphaera pollenicola]
MVVDVKKRRSPKSIKLNGQDDKSVPQSHSVSCATQTGRPLARAHSYSHPRSALTLPQRIPSHQPPTQPASPAKSAMKRMASCPPDRRRMSNPPESTNRALTPSMSKRRPRVNFDDSNHPGKGNAERSSTPDQLNGFTRPTSLDPRPSLPRFNSVRSKRNPTDNDCRCQSPKTEPPTSPSHAMAATDLDPIDSNNDNHQENIGDNEPNCSRANVKPPVLVPVTTLPSGDSGCSFLNNETGNHCNENPDGKQSAAALSSDTGSEHQVKFEKPEKSDDCHGSLKDQPETSTPLQSEIVANDDNHGVPFRNEEDQIGDQQARKAEPEHGTAILESHPAGNNATWSVSSLLANWFSSIIARDPRDINNSRDNDTETVTGTILTSTASESDSEGSGESIYLDAQEKWDDHRFIPDERAEKEEKQPASSAEIADAANGTIEGNPGEEQEKENMNILRSASLSLPRRSKTRRRSRNTPIDKNSITVTIKEQQPHQHTVQPNPEQNEEPTTFGTHEAVAEHLHVNPLRSHPVPSQKDDAGDRPPKTSQDKRRKQAVAPEQANNNKENSKPTHDSHPSSHQRTTHRRQASSHVDAPESIHVPKTRRPYRNDVASPDRERSLLPRTNVFLSPTTSHADSSGLDDLDSPISKRSSHVSSDGTTPHPLTELYSLGSAMNVSASSFKKQPRGNRKSTAFTKVFRGQSSTTAVPFPAMTKVTAEKSLRQPTHKPRPVSTTVLAPPKASPVMASFSPTIPASSPTEVTSSNSGPMGFKTMRTATFRQRPKPRRRFSDSNSDDGGAPFLSSLSRNTLRRHSGTSTSLSDSSDDSDHGRAKKLSNFRHPLPAAAVCSAQPSPANQLNTNTANTEVPAINSRPPCRLDAQKSSHSKKPIKSFFRLFSKSSPPVSKADASPPIANRGSIGTAVPEPQQVSGEMQPSAQDEQESVRNPSADNQQPRVEIPSRTTSPQPASVPNPISSATERSSMSPAAEGSSPTIFNNNNSDRAGCNTPTPVADRTSSFKPHFPSFIRRNSKLHRRS